MAEATPEYKLGELDADWKTKILATADPVTLVRIKAATAATKAELDAVNKEINKLSSLIKKSPLLRLKQALGKKTDQQWRLTRLGWDRYNLQYELENLPMSIAAQISNNRRSYQLFWIRNFLGDLVNKDRYFPNGGWRFFLISKDFPYDGGSRWDRLSADEVSHQRNLINKERSRSVKSTMDEIKQALKRDGKISLTLYDTSDPRPQLDHGDFIDLMVDLGFAIDASGLRSHDAMLADTSIDIYALDKYEGQTFDKEGWWFIGEDWLNFQSDGTVDGYLRAQGDPVFANKKPGQRQQSSDSNPVLSQLCQECNIPHVAAELTYKRDALDTKIGLTLQEKVNVVDAVAKDISQRPLLHQ